MQRRFVVLIGLTLGAFTQVSVTQERLGGRITGVIDDRSRSVVKGQLNPAAQPQLDRGRVDPLLTLSRVTVVFKRTDEQQATLDTFLKEQQDLCMANSKSCGCWRVK